jgi:hypothetical protein
LIIIIIALRIFADQSWPANDGRQGKDIYRKNSADSLWSSSLDWFFEGSEWQETGAAPRVSQPVRETEK